jgi:hypothetical protein
LASSTITLGLYPNEFDKDTFDVVVWRDGYPSPVERDLWPVARARKELAALKQFYTKKGLDVKVKRLPARDGT